MKIKHYPGLRSIKQLQRLRHLMLKLARRKDPQFGIDCIDCGTSACVDGWSKRMGWSDHGNRFDFLSGYGLTDKQAYHICLPSSYLGGRGAAYGANGCKLAARHILNVINGEIE